jgi:hypothetical protein
LYDIDTPILSQYGISENFNDWEGSYFVNLLVRPAPFALCSFRSFIVMGNHTHIFI